jgi:hypothetical protein
MPAKGRVDPNPLEMLTVMTLMTTIMWMGMMALATSIYNRVQQRGKDELSLQGLHQIEYDMKLAISRQPRWCHLGTNLQITFI